jgi:hypothetical protein
MAAFGIAVSPVPGFSQATKDQGKAKTKVPAPTPATERGPSNVELVNKALKPGASNPDVPLPHPDLANSGGDPSASSGMSQIYGRQEQGGGILGFRVPIPADRSTSGGATRSGSP